MELLVVVTLPSIYHIKYEAKVEAKGIKRMRSGAKARENVKSEVKRIGKGEMRTIGLIVAEGIERARASMEAKMRGEQERPSNHKNMVTVTMNIYVTTGN